MHALTLAPHSSLRRFALLALCVPAMLLQACASAGIELSGEVTAVSDGDTIRVIDADKRVHKIRLAYIDAPERGMPYSKAATKALSEKVYRRQVKVQVFDTDKYGRRVGRVLVDQQDVNLLQISQGWAWHYRYHAEKTQPRSDFQAYEAAEKTAREQQYGLWQGNEVMPPWDWRHSRRIGQSSRGRRDADDDGDMAAGD